MTRRELEARDAILRHLEPLAPVDRLRVLGAAALMLGHNVLAAQIALRLENETRDHPTPR